MNVLDVKHSPANDIREALDAAGYHHASANYESLKSCFLDYVASGYWGDLEFEDAIEQIKQGEITAKSMIAALRKR